MSGNMQIYPDSLKKLLNKAGLIGQGVVEVRSVRMSKEEFIAPENGDVLVFEKRVVPLDQDVQEGWTNPVKGTNGLIKGYWATGLSEVERNIINNEAGVPFYYIGEGRMDNNGTFHGKRDTVFKLWHGKRYDLSMPAHMAEVRCLLEGTFIGRDKQDAKDYNADFYFYSIEDDRKVIKKKNTKRKEAAALVDTLTIAEKQELLKVMVYQGTADIDPFITKDDAVLVFDDYAYEKPVAVMNAHAIEEKYYFIVARTLISLDVIEEADDNGPYYKSPREFGNRTHIADNFAGLIKAIRTHNDLLNKYKNYEKVSTQDPNAGEYRVDKGKLDFLSKFKVDPNQSTEEDKNAGLSDYINSANRATIIKMLNEQGVKHEFNKDSALAELREFAINNLSTDE